jgi:16S rRNA (guanine527-N7)-methyltransferase
MTVSRETQTKLKEFERLLLEENEKQNLISRKSAEESWSRHIDDSLQLLEHAPAEKHWLDIGSGPGLPGLVLAIAGVTQITLVEPRRLRTDFLERCRVALGLRNVTVVTGKAEQLHGQFDVITARAVATLDKLFAIGRPLFAREGRWVLPKGRSAEKELAEARATWQGDFQLMPSRTDPEARILVATRVRRRMGRE